MRASRWKGDGSGDWRRCAMVQCPDGSDRQLSSPSLIAARIRARYRRITPGKGWIVRGAISCARPEWFTSGHRVNPFHRGVLDTVILPHCTNSLRAWHALVMVFEPWGDRRTSAAINSPWFAARLGHHTHTSEPNQVKFAPIPSPNFAQSRRDPIFPLFRLRQARNTALRGHITLVRLCPNQMLFLQLRSLVKLIVASDYSIQPRLCGNACPWSRFPPCTWTCRS
jgi:hypothetical protein